MKKRLIAVFMAGAVIVSGAFSYTAGAAESEEMQDEKAVSEMQAGSAEEADQKENQSGEDTGDVLQEAEVQEGEDSKIDTTDEAGEESDFEYRILEDGTIEITGYKGENRENLVIPGSIDGHTVTGIGGSAFEGCHFTGMLVLPKDIQKIGNDAFSGNDFTGDLIIPDGVTTIESAAFYENNFTGDLVIPDSVITIGSHAFTKCGFTGNLTLSKNLTEIGASAFYQNDFKGDLLLPDNIKNIESSAFASNSFNGTLVLPQGLSSIEERTFWGNDFTGDLVIPDSVANIGDYAFYMSGFGGTLSLPDGLINIGEAAFYWNGFTGELILPKDIKTIGVHAFSFNRFSGNLLIPGGVTSVEANAFYSNKFTGTLTLPKGLKNIGNGAFSHNSFTGDLAIPDSVTSIGERAFSENNFTGDLLIPDSVASIGERAFSQNSFTGEIVLYSNIQAIGEGAFTSAHESNIFGDFVIYSIPDDMADIFSGNMPSLRVVGSEMGVNQTKKGQVLVNGMRLSRPLVVKWSSSDDAIARVDENGLITAMGTGEVTIQAELFNGKSCETDLKIGTENVRDDIAITTSIEQEKFSDLWVGDTIFIKVDGEDGDNIELSSVEAVSGTDCVSIEKDYERYFEELRGRWKINCRQKGKAVIQIHYKNVTQPIEIEMVINEKKDVSFRVSRKLKLGSNMWDENLWDRGLVLFTSYDNFLYGMEVPAVCIDEKSKENFMLSTGGWGGERPVVLNRNGNCSGLYYKYTTDQGYDSVNHVIMATYPGTVGFAFYRNIEDYRTGQEPMGKCDVEIEEPVISHNAKGSYEVGEEQEIEVCLKNTDFEDKVIGNASDWANPLYYTPRLEILSGQECLELEGEQNRTNLTLKQKLKFKEVGTVKLKVVYELSGKEGLSDIIVPGKEYCPEKIITIQVKEKGQDAVNKKDENQDIKKDKKVSSIQISGISKKIAAGKKIKLTAEVLPSDATNKKVQWKSSNPKIATVNQSGIVVLNKKSGGKSVKITAVAMDGSGVKAQYKITVMKGAVKKITISGGKSVKAGRILKLKAKVDITGKKANTKLKWTSSNTKYATVNASGRVKTYKAGKGKKVKITAEATDGSKKKKTVTIKIK